MSQRRSNSRRGTEKDTAKEQDRIAGRNPVLEALRSGAMIDTIYVSQESGGLQEIIQMAKEREIPVKIVTESKLNQLTGGSGRPGPPPLRHGGHLAALEAHRRRCPPGCGGRRRVCELCFPGGFVETGRRKGRAAASGTL